MFELDQNILNKNSPNLSLNFLNSNSNPSNSERDSVFNGVNSNLNETTNNFSLFNDLKIPQQNQQKIKYCNAIKPIGLNSNLSKQR